ncbi:MAG: metallophosphatase [bacterium]|nr:metallophosphatase [bacterium]
MKNNRTANRRGFLKAMTVTSSIGLSWAACRRSAASEDASLVILHTNDTHSYLEPFPAEHPKYPGLGGAARRAALIQQIRSQHKHVLLLDSGDIFPGTPYFNLFGGELEFKVMSAMKYDYTTIGNHDFDNGIDGLVKHMPLASFEFLSANYEVAGTALEPHVKPMAIRDFGDFKVGIFGLGIELSGLVLDDLYRGVNYTDPIQAARKSIAELKQAGCDLIVCLSHLGYRYGQDRVSDRSLAAEVPEIDVILGGHSHTFLNEPDIVRGPRGSSTLIHQVGWAGIRLGRIDVRFSAANQPARTVTGHYTLGNPARALS